MRGIWRKLCPVAGQSLVEYVFILMLVVILLIAGYSVVGQKTAAPIGNTANQFP